MCRQFPDRAPAPDARTTDRARQADGSPGRSRIGRRTAVLIATGLLTGLGAPPLAAQQTPDAWSAERRAVLPSGLAVQFDYAAVPGVTVTAAPGRLAEPTGGGGGTYTDGIRSGDPAETFLAAERRPRADGSWYTLGTLQLSFSRPVRNPRLHVSGLTGVATSKDGTTGTSTRLTVTGGSPAAPALVGRTGWKGWTVGSGELAPAADAAQDGTADGAGTLELAGTVSAVALRVEQRSTARNGSTTPPVSLRQAYTVTLDEGLGSAPQDYGNASHLVSDLFLGQDAAPSATRSRPGLAQSVAAPLLPGPADSPPPPADAGPVGPSVELDGGEGRRSVWASPPPPQLQPGRADYPGADPSLHFPAETAVGRYYHLDVPVSAGNAPAVLAGWIDFDHNGRFDPLERVQAEVPAGADTTALEWQVPAGATGGDTWVRLRLARNGAQLVTPAGFADSGQVVDQKVGIAIGAAKPQVDLPVSGTTTKDARPEFRGDGAVAGASIAVQENGATLCTAKAGNDGSWSCRPDGPLAEGTHTLVPVETTHSGMVLRGDAFRLTVRTTPPTAPVLTLPAYTNDPGLLLTGLGEPGSTVTVTADAGGRGATELCSTAVAPDGTWSCLPVENLADGRYQLTPHATDGAGNHVDGKPVALTVDTAAPARPHLTAPGRGELLHTARPKLTGRAEPGTTVTVTATAGHGGERATVCSAVTAPDGTWSCTPTRDLAAGDLTLLPTATDPAGNGTPGDPVTVRVAAGGASASPSAGANTGTGAGPSASGGASGGAGTGVSVSASAGAIGRPSASASASASAAASATGGVPSGSASASGSVSDVPSSAVPSAGGPAPEPPKPAEPAGTVPVPPDVLPIVVPPVGSRPGPSAGPSPTSAPQPSTSPSGAGPSLSPSAAPADSTSPSTGSSASGLPSASASSGAAQSGGASPSALPSPVSPSGSVASGAGQSSAASSGASGSASASASASGASGGTASAPSSAGAVESMPSVPTVPVPPDLLPIVVPVAPVVPTAGQQTGLPTSSGSASAPPPSLSPSPGAPDAPVAPGSSASLPGSAVAVRPSLSPSTVESAAPDASVTPVPSEVLAVTVPTAGQVPAPATEAPDRSVVPAPAAPGPDTPPAVDAPAGAPSAVVPPSTGQPSDAATPLSSPAALPAAPGDVAAFPFTPPSPFPSVPGPASDLPSAAVTHPVAGDSGEPAASAPPEGATGEADELRASSAPPPDAMAAAHRAAATGWRGLACGALLIAAAGGLLARRVLGRGSGTRRR